MSIKHAIICQSKVSSPSTSIQQSHLLLILNINHRLLRSTGLIPFDFLDTCILIGVIILGHHQTWLTFHEWGLSLHLRKVLLIVNVFNPFTIILDLSLILWWYKRLEHQVSLLSGHQSLSFITNVHLDLLLHWFLDSINWFEVDDTRIFKFIIGSY